MFISNDIKTKFLGLIFIFGKKKFQFPVKCFVVRAVKKDQVITKDGNIIWIVQFQVQVQATPRGGLQCDPGQWGKWEGQST